MRNYIHILRNLPGILKRLEDELRGKASASSVTVLCADMNSLNRRLADRPTKADLTIVEGDLGARIEKLEATTSRDELRQNIRASIERAKDDVAKANDLNAEPTGGPNLMDMLAKVKAEKIADEVQNGKMTPNAARKALTLATYGQDNPSPKSKAVCRIVTDKLKKPRKPKAPKGGGK